LHQGLSVESVGHPRKKEAHAQSGVRRKRLEIPMQRHERQILQGIGVCVRSFVTVVEAPHSLHLSQGNHSRTGTQQKQIIRFLNLLVTDDSSAASAQSN
jgi:hypothetical protein